MPEVDVILPVVYERETLPWVLERMPAGYRPIVARRWTPSSATPRTAATGRSASRVLTRGFRGVPMSADDTGATQRARLAELGLRTAELPPLLDVDTVADARAAAAPDSRFARALAATGVAR